VVAQRRAVLIPTSKTEPMVKVVYTMASVAKCVNLTNSIVGTNRESMRRDAYRQGFTFILPRQVGSDQAGGPQAKN
jgi:hypothetical protein